MRAVAGVGVVVRVGAVVRARPAMQVGAFVMAGVLAPGAGIGPCADASGRGAAPVETVSAQPLPPASTGPPDPSVPGGPTVPAASLGTYVMPTRAAVVDRFRPPATAYGPGNRGWELDTTPGDEVVSVGPGVVEFAGPVAGRGAVTVAHPDGIRSSLTGLQTVDVRVGQSVVVGERLGGAGDVLHLGFRIGDAYLDPALLIGAELAHAVLVPVPP